ncbi:MAG: MBL fold metallo-hydrolase [Clostridiales bacterium]|nr:MBL fold metallo-hydrolase [Clostridiales bacterium]
MKLRFLGTGAADWGDVTGHTDRDHRRLSSAAVDDILLIDPGPCVREFARTFGYDLHQIKYVINTHPHGDHFNADTLDYLKSLGAEYIDCAAGNVYEIGGYTVTALPGNHGTATRVQHFVIDDGGTKLFYALDAAWLLYEEFQYIRKNRIALAVFDGTIGEAEGDYRIFEHNNLRMVREMKLTLAPYIERFYISHLARTLHPSHDEVAASLEKDGIGAAYDGLLLEF